MIYMLIFLRVHRIHSVDAQECYWIVFSLQKPQLTIFQLNFILLQDNHVLFLFSLLQLNEQKSILNRIRLIIEVDEFARYHKLWLCRFMLPEMISLFS